MSNSERWIVLKLEVGVSSSIVVDLSVSQECLCVIGMLRVPVWVSRPLGLSVVWVSLPKPLHVVQIWKAFFGRSFA